MLSMVSFFICFLASIIGAICGIGGGIIIKPLMDAFHIADIKTISFLSGCTVLSMTSYSVIKSRTNGKSGIDQKTGFPLAIGAALGGLAGKWMFSYLSALTSNQDKVGGIQALCLLVITIGTLIYTIFKDKISAKKVSHPAACIIIGLLLGILSSFLGIGGGPINLVVLYFFFSMTTKIAAENSLYIIFFSQLASLLSTIITKSVPAFPIVLLVMMILGGIAGGICGKKLNGKIKDQTVDKLFIGLMVVIIFMNIYNVIFYLR